MGRALFKAFLCGIAGALAWIFCEPFFPKMIQSGRWVRDPAFDRVELWMTLLLGAFIGLASGFVHGRERGGMANLRIATLLGLVFGTMGSMFGHTIAAGIFVGMGGGPTSPTTMIARTFSFIPWGLALGAAVGASQRSTRALISGAFGGAIAGFLTGAMFDPVSTVLSSLTAPMAPANLPAGYVAEAGAPGRAVMTFGMGLLIGLFTALVDLATRKAWLRLVLGRNEGKEWPLDTAQTLIGRDERAHVPLFGDASIPPLAAVIVKHGSQYILQDPGSPIGVGHNGVRVPQAVLSPGDTIQIGNLNFQFMMKSHGAGAHEGRAKAMPMNYSPQAPQQPMQPMQPMAAQPTVAQQPITTPYQAAQPTAAYAPQPMPNQTVAYTPQVAPAMAPAATLVVTSGPMTGQRIAVSGPIEIGREGSGLAMGYDAQASRKHASVSPGPSGVQLTDLGSTNGTYVNGQRVPSAVLRSGDTVTIGSTSFRVE